MALSRLIPLANGKGETIVDAEDYDWLMQWKWANGLGYARSVTSQAVVFGYKGTIKNVIMHRLILRLENPSILADHINGNKLDNRKSNLRIVTSSQNQMNRRKHSKKASCIFKGVSWHTKDRVWLVNYSSKPSIYVGRYKCILEAAQAYNDAVIKTYGEYACLNDLSLATPEYIEELNKKYIVSGVTRKGSESYLSKLTEEQVLAIYKSSGLSTEVAKQFGVSANCVRDIRDGRSWSHVTGIAKMPKNHRKTNRVCNRKSGV